jgi:DNA-binding phage protein
VSQQNARADDHAPRAPEEDSAEQVARDLRELRRADGDPTLAALDRRCGVSKSVLSDAFSGRTLPTERTVERVVRALGGDVDAWLDRRRLLDPGARAGRRPAPDTPATVRRRTAVGWAVGAAVAGSALTLAVTWTAWAPAGASTAGPEHVVQSGTDPAETPCVDDAAVVASETRQRDTQLQIVYSEACEAAWARITRYDGASAGNTVSASIFRQIAPDATDRQDTTEPDAQSAYTTLIVRSTPQTRLCAVGSISVAGEEIDLGAPVCV